MRIIVQAGQMVLMFAILVILLQFTRDNSVPSYLIWIISVLVAATFVVLNRLTATILSTSSLIGLEAYDIVVRHTECRLVLDDIHGKKARYTKKKTIIANRDGVDRYVEKGIWMEGSYAGLEVTGRPPVQSKIRPVDDNTNRFDLIIMFGRQLKRGESVIVEMSWDIIDSFTKTEEFFTTNFGHPLNEYALKVKFPIDRPVKKAWLNFTPGKPGSVISDSSLVTSEDRRVVEFKVSYVQPGMKSILYWEW